MENKYNCSGIQPEQAVAARHRGKGRSGGKSIEHTQRGGKELKRRMKSIKPNKEDTEIEGRRKRKGLKKGQGSDEKVTVEN